MADLTRTPLVGANFFNDCVRQQPAMQAPAAKMQPELAMPYTVADSEKVIFIFQFT